MAELARVAAFEAVDSAVDVMLSEIKASGERPQGVPAMRIKVLADHSAGKVVIAVRFSSVDDRRTALRCWKR
jgi:hypothetical protein